MTMTKTPTPTDQAPATGPRKQAPREVEYTIDVIEGELPERQYGGGAGSPLEDKMKEIVANDATHGKWAIIGKYGKPTAATAAKNVLQQRHGRNPNVEGFSFATRRLQGPDEGKTGLFVKYEPGAVVEGAKAEHEQGEKNRLAKLEKARAEREAAKSAEKPSGGSTTGSSNDKAAEVQAKAEAARAKQTTKQA